MVFGKFGKKSTKPAEGAEAGDGEEAVEAGPRFSETDIKKARSWFKKAADLRDKRDYDYAIESYISGLNFWPEAVEEGHKQLRVVSTQRLQAGGKKVGMMASLKMPSLGKDAKAAMLSAETLWAKDPANSTHLDSMLKAATKGGYLETARWVAPLVMDSLRRDKKPSTSRFKAFRNALVEGAELAMDRGEPHIAVDLYEEAVKSLDFLISRNPSDANLRDEQRDLSGRLTIAKGKYSDSGSFRDSLHDAESQKLLHDADRVKQGEQTLDALIAAAKKDYEANPGVASKLNSLVEALLKKETRAAEDEAVELLMKEYGETDNYSFKARADDIRLRQKARNLRRLAKQAKAGDDADRQQYRLAAQEYIQDEVTIFRERVKEYPTDQRLKYRLGAALIRAKDYDEAIPVLQSAQNDPRHRDRCRLMIGQCFFEKGMHSQATDILSETLAEHDAMDETGKELLYWLGRSHEEAGEKDEAKQAYGKLLRSDYNYREGDARARMDALR